MCRFWSGGALGSILDFRKTQPRSEGEEQDEKAACFPRKEPGRIPPRSGIGLNPIRDSEERESHSRNRKDAPLLTRVAKRTQRNRYGDEAPEAAFCQVEKCLKAIHRGRLERFAGLAGLPPMRASRLPAHQEDDFALWRMCGVVSEKFRPGSAPEFLKRLCQLTRYAKQAIWELLRTDSECLDQAVR